MKQLCDALLAQALQKVRHASALENILFVRERRGSELERVA
jgi:hypothetical protein